MAGPGTGFDYNDAPRLHQGESGVWVAFLKETLNSALPGHSLSETDVFDEPTVEAVKDAQRMLDLPDDGVVDRMTWALISSSIYLGDVDGTFYALGLADGEVLWKKQFEDSGFLAGAAVAEGLIGGGGAAYLDGSCTAEGPLACRLRRPGTEQVGGGIWIVKKEIEDGEACGRGSFPQLW